MITSIGTHRGYKLFYQKTEDFEGVYSEPAIGHYLGQTFEQAKATINAMLDEQPESDDYDMDAEIEKLHNGE
jgi:hypothetical protein